MRLGQLRFLLFRFAFSFLFFAISIASNKFKLLEIANAVSLKVPAQTSSTKQISTTNDLKRPLQDPFTMGIQNYLQNQSQRPGNNPSSNQKSNSVQPMYNNMKSNGNGKGDYGGADEEKLKVLKAHSLISDFLKNFKTQTDFEKYYKNHFFSDGTIGYLNQIIHKEGFSFQLGILLTNYFNNLKYIFVNESCLDGGDPDYPFSLRVDPNTQIPFVCVSRNKIKNIQDGEVLNSYLIHELVHYTGVVDHMLAQHIGNEIAKAIAYVPECKINSVLDYDERLANSGYYNNEIINTEFLKSVTSLEKEDVPTCNLKMSTGYRKIRFYKTVYGKMFGFESDKYILFKKPFLNRLDDGNFWTNINLAINFCPVESMKIQNYNDKSEYLDIFSRYYFHEILIKYWMPFHPSVPLNDSYQSSLLYGNISTDKSSSSYFQDVSIKISNINGFQVYNDKSSFRSNSKVWPWIICIFHASDLSKIEVK